MTKKGWQQLPIYMVIMMAVIVGVVVYDLTYNTPKINQECESFGYEGAYHSNQGWFCWKDIDGIRTSAKYLDLKQQKPKKS